MKTSSLAALLLTAIIWVSATPARAASNIDTDNNAPVTAQLEVRISELEEELRRVSGKLEESQFQNRRIAENLDKLQKDVEYRFTEISNAQTAAAQPAATPAVERPAETPAVKPADTRPDINERKPLPTTKETQAAKDKEAAAAAAAAPKEDPKDKDGEPLQTTFANAREHYNYAFHLLNQTKYEDAATSFKAFTKKYPKDPLAGNAYYWLGETFYIRKDFVSAADGFRQGFESSTTGPKAPDNLLKLAMSLNQLKRDKEACVVLGQVVSKFGQSSANIAHKASAEQKRIGCQ